ncbi:MAG: type II toxin-antitoxin system prevent-host-death family antitoxin [Actinomycetota bacterium]|nr:type II toxin-antitoxin system prevent-host-death family antitoxin [Actinomycetota bacterium]
MTPHRAEVGIRQLRDHLSAYVARVQDGLELTVTDRGRPVARLVPHDRADRLQELIDRGLIRPPISPKRKASEIPRIRATGDVSGLVEEQRR